MTFPVSGVETEIWVPPLVAFAISFFTSMAGVSGAFLLLPFQMSVLGFTSPAVSPTNLVYNIVAIPSGVYRFLRDGRMIWPLAGAVIVGTIPGVILGGIIRVTYLPDPRSFKAFVGLVLLYIGLRLLQDIVKDRRQQERRSPDHATPSPHDDEDWRVQISTFNVRRLSFVFRGSEYSCSPYGISMLSLAVGLVGGIYGIGGGAIIAPFCGAIYGLPVHVVAGAALMGTFVTSVVGVVFFQLVAPQIAPSGMAVTPDWALGALFGLGGMAGMYLGAWAQRYIPAIWIKLLLCLILTVVAARYIGGFFLA